MEFAFNESTEGEFGHFVLYAGKISIAFDVRSTPCKTKSRREIWRFFGRLLSLHQGFCNPKLYVCLTMGVYMWVYAHECMCKSLPSGAYILVEEGSK